MATKQETTEEQTEEQNDMYYLKKDDVFTPEMVKVLHSKIYANELVKVLCAAGQQSPKSVVFSSSSSIVRLLKEPWAIGEQFIVIQTGVFKGFPVLSLKSMNKEVQDKISRALY